MTEPTPNAVPETGQAESAMPRWVKITLIVLAAVALLFVVLKLAGVDTADHGPGRHSGGNETPAGEMQHVPMDHDM